jgi:hypothetical protein
VEITTALDAERKLAKQKPVSCIKEHQSEVYEVIRRRGRNGFAQAQNDYVAATSDGRVTIRGSQWGKRKGMRRD